MNRGLTSILFLVLLLPLLGCRTTDEPTSGSFSLLATEPLVSLLRQESAEFQRIYPEMKGSVAASSTREAIVALLNDSVRVIAVDRPLNREEEQVAREASIKLTTTTFAFDGLSVLVPSDNLVKSLSLHALNDILDRKVTFWDRGGHSIEGAPIRIVLTGPNTGVYELLSRHFFHLTRPLIPDKVAKDQSEVLEAVGRNVGAIGIVAHSFLAQARQDSALAGTLSRVRVIPLMPGERDSLPAVLPSQRSLYLGEYPLRISVSLVSTERRPGPAAGLAAFVMSMTGQKIVQDAGLLPAKVPVRTIDLTQDEIK